jgi:hypothetical protein
LPLVFVAFILFFIISLIDTPSPPAAMPTVFAFSAAIADYFHYCRRYLIRRRITPLPFS